MNDIRDARFYVVDESAAPGTAAPTRPLGFDEAYAEARALKDGGHTVRVLYTEEASQMQITRFVSEGIPTELVSAG